MCTNIFCNDEIDDYEKTIYSIAISYGMNGVFELSLEQIYDLSVLLNVDYELLKKAIKDFPKDSSTITIYFGCDRYELDTSLIYYSFEIIFAYYRINKLLSEIEDRMAIESIIKNIGLLRDVIGSFEIMNANISTYECLEQNEFSFDHLAFTGDDISLKTYCNYLSNFVCEDFYKKNHGILPLIYEQIKYDVETRANTLYLISVTQLLKHSQFMTSDIQNIAGDLFNNLIFMLRNARIISVQINHLFQDLTIPFESRSRRTDNTTRMQILYGYDNYDMYCIRLDLSHKGQGFVHYNNLSPGGIPCNIFNIDEYNAIIDRYPNLINCFIRYGNRWALKEKGNCSLNTEENEQYNNVVQENDHRRVFETAYSEANIVEFIEYIGRLMPEFCNVPIDKYGEHANHCFQYDKIMFEVVKLVYAITVSEQDVVTKLLSSIVNRAVAYGIINDDERVDYTCIEGVVCILLDARKRLIIR